MAESIDRKAIEQQLAEKDRLLDAFHRIGRVMLSSLDRDVILDTLCREIVKTGILRSLMVALVDEDEALVKVVRRLFRNPKGEIKNRSDDLPNLVYRLDEDNITAEVARTGVMQVIDGWTNRFDKRVDKKDEQVDPRVSYFIPVSYENKVYAVLATGSAPEDKEDMLRRIEAMQPLFDHFVVALDHLQRYEDVQNYSLELAREVEEHKKTESALRESEARYSDLFENATDLIQSVDVEGKFIYTNRAWLETLGYSKAEADTMTMLDVIHPDEQSHCIQVFNRVMSGERIDRVETIFVTKDGRSINVEGDINCKFEEEKPISTRGIFRDITERKLIDQMKSDFISTVSHELRTPLTSIHGSLGLVIGGVTGELSEQTRSLIEIAHTNTDRLVRLINDILDMEKIESGKMAFDNQPILLLPLIEQTIEANQAYADRFGVRLLLNDSVSDAMVFADGDRVIQVFTNLISNAAKFSPEGKAVEVDVTREDGRYRIAITDHGPGMSAAFQLQVFQKFAQEDSSNTRQKGGTGLGLSISKAIVDRLNGRIWFETAPGQGTTFYVDLPIYMMEEIEPSEQTGSSKPCILICEDDPDISKLLKLLLEQEGFAVDSAYNAAQARDLIDQRTYVAMTLDLLLPDQDGLSLLKEIRNRASTRDLPVIVVSVKARESKDELQNGDAVWVVDWIDKPIEEQRLREAVALAVSPQQPHRARILHIEDDEDLHFVVMTQLHEIADLTRAGSLEEARQLLNEEWYDLVLLDVALPDGSGLDFLPELHHKPSGPIPVIVFSAYDQPPNAVQDIAASLVKSRTSGEKLVQTIKDVIQNDRIAGPDPTV